MDGQTRIVLAIGGVALGLAFAAIGTLLLGRARAIAKLAGSGRRLRADLAQYAAALLALAGFLLIAGGAAVLAGVLLPVSDTVRLVAAAVTGVILFAAAGLGFSRVADAAEEAQVRKAPPPPYRPRPEAAPVSGTRIAPVHRPRELEAAPQSAEPAPAAPARAGRVWGSPAGDPEEMPAQRVGEEQQNAAEDRREARAVTTRHDRPTTQEQLPTEPPEPAGAPLPAEDATADPVSVDDDRPTEPGDELPREGELAAAVRPGWVYRDEAGSWYLGVGGSGTHPLLRLPEFTAATASDPVYPLVVAGAGEIAVVPLTEPPAPGEPEDTAPTADRGPIDTEPTEPDPTHPTPTGQPEPTHPTATDPAPTDPAPNQHAEQREPAAPREPAVPALPHEPAVPAEPTSPREPAEPAPPREPAEPTPPREPAVPAEPAGRPESAVAVPPAVPDNPPATAPAPTGPRHAAEPDHEYQPEVPEPRSPGSTG
ncbi:MAG: hypothetical protein QOI35_3732 [Cryptosporangiaceae bacterium]|nr:hypothetical protein [Cryptosporangiaceae bacterium]